MLAGSVPLQAALQPVRVYLTNKDLSADKMVIVNRMIRHYGAIYTGDSLQPNYHAPILFVSGPPGAGKTHMMKSLVDISDIMKVGDVVRGAYMGIAGVNVGKSSTHWSVRKRATTTALVDRKAGGLQENVRREKNRVLCD